MVGGSRRMAQKPSSPCWMQSGPKRSSRKQNARIVRLGTTATQRKLFFNLRKEKAKLERMGFVPTTDRVAKAMHVPEHEVIDMEQRLGSEDTSLDAPVNRGRDDDDARSRLD